MLTSRDAFFAALGNPDRMAIVQQLLDEEAAGRIGLSVTEIAQLTGLDRFGVSRHLGVLRAGGVLRVEQWRTSRLHAVRPDAFLQLEGWLLPVIEMLESRDSACGTAAEII